MNKVLTACLLLVASIPFASLLLTTEISAQTTTKYTINAVSGTTTPQQFAGTYSLCEPSPIGKYLTPQACNDILLSGPYFFINANTAQNAPSACYSDYLGTYNKGLMSYADCQNKILQQQSSSRFRLVTEIYREPQCVPDSSGPYTFAECQAKLQEGKFRYLAATATTPAICVQDPNGNLTYDECQKLKLEGFKPGPSGDNPCKLNTQGIVVCKTAIGEICINSSCFVGRLITIAISLAGGIALIIMVIGSVKLLMSAGDPQKVAGGRDMIIAAVAGLLFLIFSVLILRYLGSNLFNFFTVT